MRAVGYVRISKADKDRTEDQQRLSLRQQADQIRETCEAKGWELLRIVEDFALSGNDDTRPGFREVSELLATGEADTVVVRHVDRLYRNAWKLLRLVDSKENGGEGWNVYSIQQAFDTSEPEGWFAFGQFAMYGDFERRIIGKRTRQALAQLRKEGKHTGRPSRIPADVEARIVALHEEGMSASAIARLFNAEGVAKGPDARSARWDHSHITAAVRRAGVRASASNVTA